MAATPSPEKAVEDTIDTEEDTEAEEYPEGISLALIVVAVILAIFLISLDQTILGTAIPKITDEFGSLNKVSWFGSAYFMTFGGLQPALGKVYRYSDLKITFLVSFIFELGSLICGVAPNATTLIVGRAIAGVGGAGMATGGFTIIAFSSEPKKRPLLTGLVGSAYGLSAISGPLIGGAFCISAAQSAFVNTMLKEPATSAPGVNPMLVITTGATQTRDVFPDQVDGILQAYMAGLKATFAISIGTVGFAALLAVFSPRKRLHGSTELLRLLRLDPLQTGGCCWCRTFSLVHSC